MGFTELRNNLIDIIREEQAKLGFRVEKIRLYYPLSSLNHLLEAHDDADAMNARLAAMPAEITDTLGDVVVTHKGDRFCFNIPEKGSVYVHENTPDNDFIKALVDLLAGHGTTLDDVLALFMSYSPDIICEPVDNGEFDVLYRFPENFGDPYFYCFKDEGCHIIYHRFLPADYYDFDF